MQTHRFLMLLFAALLSTAMFITTSGFATETWTLACIGDQQLAIDQANYQQYYTSTLALVNWIGGNAQTDNIRFVTQVGDIVQNGDDSREYNRALDAMQILDTSTNADGVTGIPWCVAYGNHEADQTQPGDDPAGTKADNYRDYFGSSGGVSPHRYAGQIGFGGVSANDLNTYHYVTSSDDPDARTYLLLNLEYDVPGHAPGMTPSPSDIPDFDAIAWAQGIIDANPYMPTIINTHVYAGTAHGPPSFPYTPGPGRNSQNDIFDKLVADNPQIFMVLSGHTGQNTYNVRHNSLGQPVLQMVTDFHSSLPKEYVRLIEFDETAGLVNVSTYCPGVSQDPTPHYLTDSYSQYSLAIDWENRFKPATLPVGHWQLNEEPGSYFVAEATGNWANGVMTGSGEVFPQFIPGLVGNALSFDGIDDGVTIPASTSVNLSGPLSISVWINVAASMNGRIAHIVGQDAEGWNDDKFYLKYDGDSRQIRFGIMGTSGNTELISRQTVSPVDGFVHLVGVYDPNNSMQLFINGQLDAQQTANVPSSINAVSTPLTLGRPYGSPGGEAFWGTLDEVRLYNTILDPDYIESLYAAPFETNLTFQQGEGGYAGTADTHIGTLFAATDRGSDAELGVFGMHNGEEMQTLLRFDDLISEEYVPEGSDILSAVLKIQTGDSLWDGTSETCVIKIFRLLQSFDDADTWASSFGGDGVQNDGIEAELWPDAVWSTSIADGDLVSFDLTESVQAWADGAENYGWLICQESEGSNRWYFSSAEGTDPPCLEISLASTIARPLIPGDANGNGQVDAADAAILADNWLSVGATWAMGDFNYDGLVNDIDATLLAGNWQYGVTPATAIIPESSTIAILIGMLICLTLKRYPRALPNGNKDNGGFAWPTKSAREQRSYCPM